MRFEKFVALFEFVVLMNSIKVHRAHVIQLALEFFDELFNIWRSEFRRAWRRRNSALQFLTSLYLGTQSFLERRLIGHKLAKIDLVAPGNMLRQIVDFHLQLRLAHLPLTPPILRFAQ